MKPNTRCRALVALTAVAALGVAPRASAADEPAVEFFRSESAAKGGYPFSEAVRVDSLLFLSGALGVDPATGQLVTGGIEAEAKQTMDNIGAALKARGLDFGDLVKCTVFLADMAEWGRFNGVYRGYFANDRYPARSALGANGLALDARVEVECIARLRD